MQKSGSKWANTHRDTILSNCIIELSLVCYFQHLNMPNEQSDINGKNFLFNKTDATQVVMNTHYTSAMCEPAGCCVRRSFCLGTKFDAQTMCKHSASFHLISRRRIERAGQIAGKLFFLRCHS